MKMIDTARRISLLVAYQFAVLLGIVLMPLALITRNFGLRLPIGDVLTALGEAYDGTARQRAR